jgi:hypothetical protein
VVHGDVCENCGRFTTAPPTAAVELSAVDTPCTAGPIVHEHSSAERVARIDAYFRSVRRGAALPS